MSDRETVRWNHLRPAALCVALSLSAACASYNAGIARNDRPSTLATYFYGHFGTNPRSTGGGADGYSTMGFLIGCDDGASYTIRFSNQNQFQVVKGRPARCTLEKIVFIDADGAARREISPPDGWGQEQEFAAGHAYYLGDYVGGSTYDFKTKELNWRLQSADDRYELSTQALRDSYRGFATLPTENRAFVRLGSTAL